MNKFRVFLKEKNKLVYPEWIKFYKVFAEFKAKEVYGYTVYRPNCKNVDIMQCTGLKDKNGKEIYEGDIVSMEAMTPGAPSIVGEVQFEESCYWVVNEKQEKGVRLFQEGVYIEKLGNIFENLELLKEFRDETKA